MGEKVRRIECERMKKKENEMENMTLEREGE